MKKIILFSCLLWSQLGYSQTVVWQNDFETPAEWTLNTPTGINGTFANEWLISDDEGGVAPGLCGVASNGNKTLYINNGLLGATGAAYLTGPGLGGTNKRTSLASNINLTPNTNLTLSLDYMGEAQSGVDFASVLYSIDGGLTWITLTNLASVPTGGCAPQGTWVNFTIALPVAVEGQPDVRLAFNWTNNEDGIGADPSFAVNNLKITTPAVGGIPVVTFPAITPICAGSTFTSTNTYTNSPTSYVWTGSAGVTFSSATIANPVISFTGAGTYTLNVVATNGTGSSTMATQTIVVTAAPTATISYTDPICLSAPANVLPTITGNTSGTFTVPPGGLTLVTATGAIVPFMSTAGTYTITYTIPASGGCPIFTTTDITTLSACLVPVVTFPAIAGICLGSTFTPTNTYTNSPTSYAWTSTPVGVTFSSATAANPVISFPGGATTYTLNVVATNGSGSSTMATQTIVITATPTAIISYADPICLTAATASPTITGNTTGSFSSTAALTIASSTGVITPTSSTAGTYTVTYTIPASGGCPLFTTTDETTLAVCAGIPAAAFTIPGSPCINVATQLTDNSTNGPTSWLWSVTGPAPLPTFSSTTAQNPTITFTVVGAYTITLVATNADGSNSFSNPLPINAVLCGIPTASWSSVTTAPCLNSATQFTGSDLSANGPILTWAWTSAPAGAVFSSTSISNPTISFPTATTYVVSLIITNATGASTAFNSTVNPIVCPVPTAAFSTTPNNVCIGATVATTNSSTSAVAPITYQWSVTPATFTVVTGSLTSINPTFSFQAAGPYTISLIASNINGPSTNVVNSIITVISCPPPVAAFTVSAASYCLNSTVNLNDVSINSPTSWAWSVTPTSGAALSSAASQNTTVSFSTAGTYTIQLVATNQYGTNTTTQVITSISCGLPTAFFVVDTTLCKGDCIVLKDASTFPTSPVAYPITGWNWTIGGTLPGTSSNKNPDTICFDTPGIYTIRLEVTNINGISSYLQTIKIDPTIDVDITTLDSTIIIGESIVINTQGFGGFLPTYTWDQTVTNVVPDGSSIVVDPLADNTYILSYSTIGCEVFDTINIKVFVPLAVGVPDAFSPNGDGVNDLLFVKGIALKSIDFKVWNRLGQLVFETKNQEIGWDGKFKGDDENPGGFVYILNYVRLDASKGTLKGSVSIIK